MDIFSVTLVLRDFCSNQTRTSLWFWSSSITFPQFKLLFLFRTLMLETKGFRELRLISSRRLSIVVIAFIFKFSTKTNFQDQISFVLKTLIKGWVNVFCQKRSVSKIVHYGKIIKISFSLLFCRFYKL